LRNVRHNFAQICYGPNAPATHATSIDTKSRGCDQPAENSVYSKEESAENEKAEKAAKGLVANKKET
jgi:hypothetical protein